MLPMEFAGVSKRRAAASSVPWRFSNRSVWREASSNGYSAKLSGGEQQRVAIARALANRPEG